MKVLAVQIGLDVRTLERRFGEQFRTTPKAWIMHERMSIAPPLLAGGLSNKELSRFDKRTELLRQSASRILELKRLRW